MSNDYLPEACRSCHQGTYCVKEFLEDKAAEYLKNLGINSRPGRLYREYCLSACFHAKVNGDDINQFYEIRHYDCPYKDQCNLGKLL